MSRITSEDRDTVFETLASLGLKMEEGRESRPLSLLRTILRLQGETKEPLPFSEVYQSFTKEGPGKGLTKAWVHRVLKLLIEQGFVRVDSPTATRKRYTSDVNSVMAALEKMRGIRIEDMKTQIAELQKELKTIERIDPGVLAQDLHHLVTGKEQPIRSRSIKGLDEWHRVTDSTIFEKAKPGDVIRTSVMNVGPFLIGVEDRLGRLFEAGSRGVDIRYMIPPEVFRQDDEIRDSVGSDWIVNALGQMASFAKKGMKFDVRINMGTRRSFAFIGLNDEHIALLISENPIMGAWMNRDFNPHLIDNALTAFDDTWSRSKSIIGLKPADLAKLGVVPGSYLQSLIEQGEKLAENEKTEEKGDS
jgi:Fe2+ or Zn2+ uptake regulation protein